MISAKVVADSRSPAGVRLTTLQLCYPRFVHSEFMTHRVFSRNAASSRAIPITKMIEQVMNDPALPVHWGRNQPGMQAREELDAITREKAILEWKAARISAIEHVKRLSELGVHKQIANRLLEPFQYMQTIVTATEWNNYYNLRRHADAQPEIKVLADMMFVAMEESMALPLAVGDWHLPYVAHSDKQSAKHGGREISLVNVKKWSTARCARVSYLTHDKKQPEPHKDEELHDRLLESGHFSPFEHQATPGTGEEFNANFRGWKSYRFTIGC